MHTFTVSAVDVAGHTVTKSVTYTVGFVFGGFQQPVDNPPTVNIANAGSTIPLKWTILDAAGQHVREHERDPGDLVQADSLSGRHRPTR